MAAIPFSEFDGYLKQHSHERLGELEKRLFGILFPSFEGDPEVDIANEQWADSPLFKTLGALVQYIPGEGRPRRFAGYGFPRSRYYSIASDGQGNDNQTLAHELRAYRDPTICGMVEVLDIAGGCNLVVRDKQIRLPAAQEIVVLIHDPELLPPELRSLQFRELPGLRGKPLLLYRFPYSVRRRRIDKAIDLRRPPVREWFFETFRTASESTSSASVPETADATIAYSRFHLENGRAPTPSSFWEMLPTLINPDLGGGNPGTTGSTIWLIAHWMRQNGVGALVYPSARCDAAVKCEARRATASIGWNLVDYHDTKPFGDGVHLTTFDPSPWAWVALPDGVVLHKVEHGKLAGSFGLEGMVDYWAKDYLGQVQALEAVVRLHGPERRFRTVSRTVRARAFWLGVLCARWFRLALNRQPQQCIEERITELRGLALSLDLYECAGRIAELWGAMKTAGVDTALTATECAAVADRMGRALGRRLSDPSLGQLLLFGCDLEFLALNVSALAKGAGVLSAAEASRIMPRCPPDIDDLLTADAAKAVHHVLAEAPGWMTRGTSGEQLELLDRLVQNTHAALKSG